MVSFRVLATLIVVAICFVSAAASYDEFGTIRSTCSILQRRVRCPGGIYACFDSSFVKCCYCDSRICYGCDSRATCSSSGCRRSFPIVAIFGITFGAVFGTPVYEIGHKHDHNLEFPPKPFSDILIYLVFVSMVLICIYRIRRMHQATYSAVITQIAPTETSVIIQSPPTYQSTYTQQYTTYAQPQMVYDPTYSNVQAAYPQYVNTGPQYVNSGPQQYVNSNPQYVNSGPQYVTSPQQTTSYQPF